MISEDPFGLFLHPSLVMKSSGYDGLMLPALFEKRYRYLVTVLAGRFDANCFDLRLTYGASLLSSLSSLKSLVLEKTVV
jgi:hypothetical protein